MIGKLMFSSAMLKHSQTLSNSSGNIRLNKPYQVSKFRKPDQGTT